MKQLYAVLLFAAFCPFSGIAQNFAKNNIQAHAILTSETSDPGAQQWEKKDDLVSGPIRRSQLLKMKGVTGQLVSFLHDYCISEGDFSPAWRGEYFSKKNSPGPRLSYGLTCRFPGGNDEIRIVANDIRPLLDHLAVGSKDYLTIKVAAAEKLQGFYYEASGMTKSWLITADSGRVPFTPVTRKEYLEEAKAELTGEKSMILTELKAKMPVRSEEVQTAEKTAAIDQLKAQYSGVTLDVRMRQFLNSYRTDEQYLEENTKMRTGGIEGTLRMMDSLLVHYTAKELDRPAIVSVPADEFRGFEDGRGDKMLIRLNSSYYKADLPEEIPQLFLVTWHYDPSDPATAVIDRQLAEKMDMQWLRELLGH